MSSDFCKIELAKKNKGFLDLKLIVARESDNYFIAKKIIDLVEDIFVYFFYANRLRGLYT